MSDRPNLNISKAKHGLRRANRIARLSMFELIFSILLSVAALIQYFQNASVLEPKFPGFDSIFIRSSSVVLLTGFWAVMNTFSFILNRQTLLIGSIARQFKELPSESDGMGASVDEVRARADWSEISKALQATQEALAKEEKHAVTKGGSELKASIEVFRDRLSGVELDVVELEFRQYLVRSGAAAATAQRRPNALLFIGTIIAVLGLIFFIITLPGSRFGILLAPEAQVAQQGQVTTSHEFVQLLPRLLMLVFIQVLAGFFLKQYRASMEDFRYYESILRHREAQYLSYVLRKRTEDKKAILAFSKEIMEDRQLFGMLARGQTTMMLEAQRMERNEFASFYEVLAETAIAAKERLTVSQQRARSKKKGDEDGSSHD